MGFTPNEQFSTQASGVGFQIKDPTTVGVNGVVTHISDNVTCLIEIAVLSFASTAHQRAP